MFDSWEYVVDNTNILELIKKGINKYNDNVDDSFYNEEDIENYYDNLYYENNEKSYEEFILSWVGEYIATEIYDLSLNNRYNLTSKWHEDFRKKLDNDENFFNTSWYENLTFKNIGSNFNIESFITYDNIIEYTNLKELIINHTKNFFKYL